MSNIQLTKQQLDQIKQDMNQKVEMLTDAEVNVLARKVNGVVNFPFLNEEKELAVFIKVIRFVDKQLYKLLPNEYYALVKDASDGISEREAKNIENRLTPLINNLVNIPVLTEKHEEKLIGLILSLIIKAMIKGFKLGETAIA